MPSKHSANEQAQVMDIVLGSGSPQRLDLMRLLLPATDIRVVIPQGPELEFDGAHTWPAIENILRENAERKADDVQRQLATQPRTTRCLICADTIIVAADAAGDLHCLGKPSEPNWPADVRQWFHEYYTTRSHYAVSAVEIRSAAAVVRDVVRTEIRFRPDACDLLDWYISTGEPQGKAGGYAIQGVGSVFAVDVQGSLSNVIGLPLELLIAVLPELGVALAE